MPRKVGVLASRFPDAFRLAHEGSHEGSSVAGPRGEQPAQAGRRTAVTQGDASAAARPVRESARGDVWDERGEPGHCRVSR